MSSIISKLLIRAISLIGKLKTLLDEITSLGVSKYAFSIKKLNFLCYRGLCPYLNSLLSDRGKTTVCTRS